MALRSKVSAYLQHPGLPLAVSCLVTVVMLAWTVLHAIESHARAIQNERMSVQGDLGIIRSNLEGALNSRILIGKGLAAYIAMKPDLTFEDFTDYAERLVGQEPVIRNVTIVKGSTVIYAYPQKGNEKIIGRDLAKIPDQREGFLKAVETQQPIVIANVSLVQGGIASINRIPVFLKPGDPSTYWGQVSLVLMQDVLFREAKLEKGSFGLHCTLREKQAVGHAPNYLFGEAGALQDKRPVELDVIFPHGAWTLSGIPEKGWGYSDSHSLGQALAGTMLSIVLGTLVFMVTRSFRRIQQLESVLPICSHCKKIRSEDGSWSSVESYFSEATEVTFSHGLCPDCLEKEYRDNPWIKRR